MGRNKLANNIRKRHLVTCRFTDEEHFRVKHFARLYCDGSVSEWIRQCTLRKYVPAFSKRAKKKLKT